MISGSKIGWKNDTILHRLFYRGVQKIFPSLIWLFSRGFWDYKKWLPRFFFRSRLKAETSKWSEAAIFWIEKPKGKNQIILGNIFKPWDSKICEGECFFALLGRFIIAFHTKNKFFIWKVTVFKVLHKKVLFLKKKGGKWWKTVLLAFLNVYTA